MPDQSLVEYGITIILIVFLVAAIILERGNSIDLQIFEKKISEESLGAGLYYATQALPCLSRNPEALDETRKFVLDRALLDSEIQNRGRLSCADYGEVKYWAGIYDLDRPEGQWTFRNFQPLEEDKFVPRYGQIVLINDNGKMHRAFIGVSVDMLEAKGKLPLYLFCNSTGDEPKDFKPIFNDWPQDDKGRGIEDIYSYGKNDCDSGNCIKGAGQALPSCQPKECTYSGDAGAACTENCGCKSFACSKEGKCEDKKQRSLIAGQPCKSDAECGAGLACAYDKRCRDKANLAGGITIAPFEFK